MPDMSDLKAPPEIFDMRLLEMRRQRGLRRQNKTGLSFLIERCLKDLADRLMDVNRTFDHILMIGPESHSDALKKLILNDLKVGQITSARDLNAVLKETQYDAVISLLKLQSENDLPGCLIRMKQMLLPDGLFVGAMFGGETLAELRQALYKTDEVLLGGSTPRVFPMADYSQAAALLSRAGLNLPVVDTDRLTVAYSALDKLIGDLRDLGETNVLMSRDTAILPRTFKQTLKEAYSKIALRADGKYLVSFEVLWLTGWSPHENQQKPLKPGSAKMRLADALKVKEEKL